MTEQEEPKPEPEPREPPTDTSWATTEEIRKSQEEDFRDRSHDR